jgi:hypothetical protein
VVNASGQIVNQPLGMMDAFAIHTGARPLAVTLASFAAAQAGRGRCCVSWETASELNNTPGSTSTAATAPAGPERATERGC